MWVKYPEVNNVIDTLEKHGILRYEHYSMHHVHKSEIFDYVFRFYDNETAVMAKIIMGV